MSAKVALGVLRDCRKFSGHPYIYRPMVALTRSHRAVIFAVAQLSCFSVRFVAKRCILQQKCLERDNRSRRL